MKTNILTCDRAKKIRLLILDVDGVLTDGKIYYNAHGEESKSFFTQDGLGLKLLQKQNIKQAVITGRDDACVAHRVKALGIDYYFSGISDKLEVFKTLLLETGLKADECAYIGDDIVDLPVMTRVGLAVAVANAHLSVKCCAHYTTNAAGGLGAVRELCELILNVQDKWHDILGGYLK